MRNRIIKETKCVKSYIDYTCDKCGKLISSEPCNSDGSTALPSENYHQICNLYLRIQPIDLCDKCYELLNERLGKLKIKISNEICDFIMPNKE